MCLLGYTCSIICLGRYLEVNCILNFNRYYPAASQTINFIAFIVIFDIIKF